MHITGFLVGASIWVYALLLSIFVLNVRESLSLNTIVIMMGSSMYEQNYVDFYSTFSKFHSPFFEINPILPRSCEESN